MGVGENRRSSRSREMQSRRCQTGWLSTPRPRPTNCGRSRTPCLLEEEQGSRAEKDGREQGRRNTEGWRVSHRRLSVPCLFGRLHGEYAMEEVDGEEEGSG